MGAYSRGFMLSLLPNSGGDQRGPAGSGVISLDTIPSPTEFATGRLPGAATSYRDTAAVDAAVAGVEASQIDQPLPLSSTIPPSTSSVGFVYNRVWQLIQSRPAGVAAVILKATLRNDTGGPVTSLQVRYDFDKQSTNVQGELPGHYVYYSWTGATGSWAKVEQLYGVDLVGAGARFVDTDGTGSPGWRSSIRRALGGAPAKQIVQEDRDGTVIPQAGAAGIPPMPGSDLVLTSIATSSIAPSRRSRRRSRRTMVRGARSS